MRRSAQSLPSHKTTPNSIELHPQTSSDANGSLSMEATTPSVAPVVPPLQAMPQIPAESPLSISQNEPAPNVYVTPMLVDESDHEEVPTIDLGSDSDA
jgi:hypothetical protein